MNKYLVLAVMVLLLAGSAFAMSQSEATSFANKKNNYLLDNEQAVIYEPAVKITYNKNLYWVVAGVNDTTVGVYIPINDNTQALANAEIEKRKLIETEIVLSKMYQLKSGPYSVAWPFTYTSISDFYNYQTKFNNMYPRVVSIQTELGQISGASEMESLAEDIGTMIDGLAQKSLELAQTAENVRVFENDFFVSPDTNEVDDYSELMDDFFMRIAEFKLLYNTTDSEISTLKGAIASSQVIASTEKERMIGTLSLPVETSKLPSFFTNMDQIKQLSESVFNTSKNVETYIGNLETRRLRNDAWQVIYNTNEDILKLNSSLSTVATAAEAILSEDNVNNWTDQDSVEALKVNWTQAKKNYENSTYDKAKNFGVKAGTNIKDILEAGTPTQTPVIQQEFIIQIIGILIAVLVGIFIIEKVILKKKKKEGDEEYVENYEQ